MKSFTAGWTNVPKTPYENCLNTTETWSPIDATKIRVRRGPKYRRNKKKEPSKSALYDSFSLDFCLSEKKVEDMGKILKFTEEISKKYTDPELDAMKIPTFFIVHMMLPLYAPNNPLWGATKDDGPSAQFTCCMGMKKEIRDEIKKPLAEQSAAVKLLVKFLRGCIDETSDIKLRMKQIQGVEPTRLEECKLGSTTKKLARTYNYKPAMTRPYQRYRQYGNRMELQIDAHKYSYMFRKYWHSIQAVTGSMYADMVFVIQGETDDELPERILGGFRLNRLTSHGTEDRPQKRWPTVDGSASPKTDTKDEQEQEGEEETHERETILGKSGEQAKEG
eukprot:g2465.t1